MLKSYDDLFSDFDPRAYSERNISDDFIDELKARISVRDKYTQIKRLVFLIPNEQYIKKNSFRSRNLKDEEVIKKRIIDYFKLRRNKGKKSRFTRT